MNSGADPDRTMATLDAWYDATEFPNIIDRTAEWIDEIVNADNIDVAFAASVAGMSTQIDTLIPQLVAELGALDEDPSIDIVIAGTPRAGDSVDLSVTATAGDTVTWDLNADGAYDDATGATTTWTVPGDAMVGAPLFVSARLVGANRDDSITEMVVVAAGGNRAPVIAEDPAKSIDEVAPGTTLNYAITASDPNGDPLTYEWLVNGVTQAGQTTNAFTLNTPADSLDTFFVEVLVSDGAATTKSAFFVWTVTADDDNDGYMAAPGPDCEDDPANPPAGASPQYVHPNRNEVGGNGVDDNCDGQVDEPGPPGNLAFSLVTAKGTVGSTSVAYTTEGEFISLSVSWLHHRRFSGDTFRLTADWADGTIDTVDVSGFNSATTTAVFEHQYGDQFENQPVEVCWEWLDDPADPNESLCFIRQYDVLNDRPFVNAADLRTWSASQLSPAVPSGSPSGDLIPLDPDGRTVMSTGNPSNNVAIGSPVNLGPTGYGRAMMTHESVNGNDDDHISMLFGYDPTFDVDPGASNGPEGEYFDPAADFVRVLWSHSEEVRWDHGCNDAVYSPGDYADPFIVARVHGLPTYYEAVFQRTAAIPYDPSDDASDDGGIAQDPGCDDGPNNGVETLGSVDSPLLETDQLWRRRSVTASDPSDSRVRYSHLIEYDYQPDSITVWVNGVEQIKVINPDPINDPYPPGSVAIETQSQPSIRYSAAAPTPVFQFVQGKGGEFNNTDPATGDPILPDGISVPMTDGAHDTHEARIDWGDGTSTTEGVVTLDPATGYGWFTITGDHAYAGSGEFTGNVCATDDEGLSTCFPFIAVVANQPAIVNAGPDTIVGPDVSFSDMNFQDPGPTDTHTATIDWGDGTALDLSPVVLEDRGGGTVTGTHTYAAAGDYTVELCVADQGAAIGCDTREVEVRAHRVAPELKVEAFAPAAYDIEGLVGDPVPVGAGFTDRDVDETHVLTVNWGDGGGTETVAGLQSRVGCFDIDLDENDVELDCQAAGSATPAHTYSAEGIYTVEFEVCDSNSLCDTEQSTVTITNALKIPFLVPLTPARLLDTRTNGDTIDGLFQANGTIVGNTQIELTIVDRGGIPATGVDAVVLNITAANPTGVGFITAHPCDTLPNASSLNYITATNNPNEIIAKLSPTGTICLYASTATHLVADTVGYIPT